jgi:hypothetical protein
MSQLGQTLRRFLAIAAIAFWIGGFTFYTSVVVHVGAAVLHSHRRQGFITQHVTNWLNLSGAIALVILVWELVAARNNPAKWARRAMIGSWTFMAALQVALLAVHPMMDIQLNPQTREILDEPRFGNLHDVYIWLATIQWCGALLFIFAMLWAWSAVDGAVATQANLPPEDAQPKVMRDQAAELGALARITPDAPQGSR